MKEKTNPIKAHRYVDLLTDSGFKAVFGDQKNKQVLIDFLNASLTEDRFRILLTPLRRSLVLHPMANLSVSTSDVPM